jgi:hypothetical protein
MDTRVPQTREGAVMSELGYHGPRGRFTGRHGHHRAAALRKNSANLHLEVALADNLALRFRGAGMARHFGIATCVG